MAAQWTDRVGAPARPRILFSDNMLVLNAGGFDTRFRFARSAYGFDTLNHYIDAVGPQDLAPANHAALKARLTRQIETARALPFDPEVMAGLEESIARRTVIDMLRTRKQDIMSDFARREPAIASLGHESWQGVDHEYLYRQLVNLPSGGSAVSLLNELRGWAARSGASGDLEKAEFETTRDFFLQRLAGAPLEDEAKNALVDRAVRVSRHGGRQHVAIDPAPLEEYHRSLIDRTYGDLDAVIGEARRRMVEKAGAERRNPFEPKMDEMIAAAHIHNVADEDRAAKAVVQVGYADPDLTIIVEKEPMIYVAGGSYPHQNLIRIDRNNPREPFDPTLTEELLHQGVDKLYRNISLPYASDSDPRKALLEAALAADAPQPLQLATLGFAGRMSYNYADARIHHQEIPVKVMKIMDGPNADPETLAGFPQVARFARDVIVRDAVAHQLGQPLPSLPEAGSGPAGRSRI